MAPDLIGETKSMPNSKLKTTFARHLYPLLAQVNKGISELEMYEFQYCLNNLIPENGWENVSLRSIEEIQAQVETRAFYDSIQIKPVVNSKIVLDKPIQALTQELLVGLVNGKYTPAWVKTHFYFDIRGFYFLHRTCYYTPRYSNTWAVSHTKLLLQIRKHLKPGRISATNNFWKPTVIWILLSSNVCCN